jgi:hypothetical protein
VASISHPKSASHPGQNNGKPISGIIQAFGARAACPPATLIMAPTLFIDDLFPE